MSEIVLPDRYRMSPLELATGMPRGTDPSTPPLPSAPVGRTARQCLEDVIACALVRAPCVVSFSGGRDSSAVLALAAHVARREGLPLPVPISQRFPDCADADEDSWQDLVVRHLALPDWIRLDFQDELDTLGPYATRVLERHGPLFPFNAHFHLPIAERAVGGTLLTGFGGDELLHPAWFHRRVNELLTGQVSWTRRDPLRVAAAYGPASVRRLVVRRRRAAIPPRPWLRPEADRAVTEAAIRELAAEPVRWDVAVDHAWWRLRYRRASEAGLACVAGMHDVAVCHPLTDGRFIAAAAREGGRTGYPSRTEAMRRLAGDLLPPETTTRGSKAILTDVFWNRYAMAFGAAWDGSGLDPDIVNVDILRRMWSAGDRDAPDLRTHSLLQTAWLSSRPTNDARQAG